MANIGDVSATLRADIGQYTGPMQEAAQATKAVQASVEEASTALLKEGAAGQAAGKGLATVGAETQALAQQLAQAEGRLVQLGAAFHTLGIQPAGKDFAEASANVARLRAQLQATAPELAKVQRAETQVTPALMAVGNAATSSHHAFGQLRGSLTAITASIAGVPGPVGNLASKLLMFGVGGPVTIAVTAGLAAAAFAFTKFRENAVKESEEARQAIDGLVEAYRNRTGEITRLNKEQAQNALTAAQARLRSLEQTTLAPSVVQQRMGDTTRKIADPEAVARTTAEIQRLQIAVREANDALTEFNAPKVEGQKKAAEAARATTAALQNELVVARMVAQGMEAARARGDRDIFGVQSHDLDVAQQILRATQERARAHQQVVAVSAQNLTLSEAETAALVAGTNALLQRRGILSTPLTPKEIDQLKEHAGEDPNHQGKQLKQSIEDAQQQGVEAMRGVANAISRAFMDTFSDNQQSMMERIVNVLSAALQEAVERLIAQQLFAGLVDLFSPAKGLGGGGVGDIVGQLPLIGGLFGAPSLPEMAPATMTSGATIVVPLDQLPRPLSPIEMARDQMHQAVWIETARQAQSNGVNLVPRFR